MTANNPPYIDECAASISDTFGPVLIERGPDLMRAYHLSGPEYSVALTQSLMTLLAGSIVAMVDGVRATDAEYQAAVLNVVAKLQGAVGSLIEERQAS